MGVVCRAGRGGTGSAVAVRDQKRGVCAGGGGHSGEEGVVEATSMKEGLF